MEIRIEKTQNPKAKPADESKLGFGNYYTDHMFVMNYDEGQGWHDARIVPYGPIELDPAAMCLHYGQEVFEGLKAYRCENGDIRLFRPDRNMARLNISNERLCIPQIDEEFAVEAIKTLVKVDEDWIPSAEGTSLYIRPFIIATDVHIGVHPSHSYKFIIILSPVGSYYPEGIKPVKIFVEREYVRAVKGGTGYAKVGGNYACSLIGQEKAEKLGYSQVLWLDGIEHKYIDEVGAMNVFFVLDGTVVTPTLDGGNILPGVTRASCIQLLQKLGYKVEERKLSLDEVIDAYNNGKLNEAFGTGTAAVVSPIGLLDTGDIKMTVNNGEIGEIAQKLYDTLTGIQWGKLSDDFGWTVKVD